MTRYRLGKEAGVIAVFVVALAAAGCSPSSGTSEAAETNGDFVKVVNVEVEEVTPTDFTSYIRLTGEVEAMNDVTLSAEESGVIERFYLEKGQYVRAGQPIAKIRDRVLRAQVEEAAASAQLAAERHERQRRLWEDEKIGSEITYLEAKYQAELQAARLETLEARLERTTIEAPISGIFDERLVDAGEMVAPGTPVARLVEVGRVKVTGGVPERFAASVTPGDSARINFDVLPDQQFTGMIEYVGRTVDKRNRTFLIEVVIENPGRVIKPHMVANVEVADRRLQDVIVVLQSAILRVEDGYQVYVAVERDGVLIAVARPVRLGATYQNRTVILSGLDSGERLIVRGQQLVEVGDRVRVVNDERAGA